MTYRLGYHMSMRSWRFIWLALIGVAVLPVEAQINGTRPSVTSLGGSQIFPPGPPASVTSLGPRGYTPDFRFPNCCFPFGTKHNHPDGFFNRPHGFGSHGVGYGVLPVYSMPYYGYGDVVNPVDDSMEQAYGPVSERADRGAREAQSANDDGLQRLEQQVGELENSSGGTEKNQPTPDKGETATDQPNTRLIFRDGHSEDVKNYAIVGDTLYDFSGVTRRRIPLVDLDLESTQKQNDQRGIDFRLPKRAPGT